MRITPAGAGKTTADCDRQGRREDHPRRCGENRCQRQPIIEYIGSPPQVRGKHSPPSRQRISVGITPAGAGKTCVGVTGSRHLWDHPRRCGENQHAPKTYMGYSGSPPQVRGKHLAYLFPHFAFRITPAGAGKTLFSCSVLNHQTDHPRRCGENA